MTEHEANAYGMSEQDIYTHYINGDIAQKYSLELAIMKILTSSQQFLEMNCRDACRQQINIAKFILAEIIKARLLP